MLESIFREALKKGVFPGAATAVAVGCASDRQTEINCYGDKAYQGDKRVEVNHETFYDLASLTKPLATLPALLLLLKEGKFKLETTLPALLQREVPREKREIRLRDILGHAAGLPAYLPLFRRLPPGSDKESVLRSILAHPLSGRPGSQTLYSDPGFILAGLIVELHSGEKLADFVRQRIYEPLGLGDKLFFNPLGQPRPGLYAAGEYCHWRRRLLYGEVGDENCALMGGAAGHAGLFGTIEGVAGLLASLLDLWLGRNQQHLFDRDDLSRCFRRQQLPTATTWALGVDTPSAEGSSGGRYLLPSSIGHLGYSGTSFWLDPQRELVMVLLSNRVHPSRFNDQIKKFRPRFHDAVIESRGLV